MELQTAAPIDVAREGSEEPPAIWRGERSGPKQEMGVIVMEAQNGNGVKG